MKLKDFQCADCRIDTSREPVILQDVLWESLWNNPDHASKNLCFFCIEKRLSRQLQVYDLKQVPLNLQWVARIWYGRDDMPVVDSWFLVKIFQLDSPVIVRQHPNKTKKAPM